MSKINYPGWELKFFDKSYNFRKYQFDLIKKYLEGHVAEVGPGNGGNLVGYIKNPKKIDLYEPSKKLFINLKKKFKKHKKIKFFNSTFNRIKKYDAILYLDVLEHINKDKAEVAKALKCHQDWCLPRHCHHHLRVMTALLLPAHPQSQVVEENPFSAR